MVFSTLIWLYYSCYAIDAALVKRQTVCQSTSGLTYKAGETFVQHGFKFQCQTDGSSIVIACVPRPGVDIAVGKTSVDGDMERDCFQLGNNYLYGEQRIVKGYSGSGAFQPPLVVPPSGGTVSTLVTPATTMTPRVTIASQTTPFTSRVSSSTRTTLPPATTRPRATSYQPPISTVGTSTARVLTAALTTPTIRPVGSICGGGMNAANDHRFGETWIQRGFRMRCDANGVETIIGCVNSRGTEIPLGQSVTVNNMLLRCQKQGGGYMYDEVPIPPTNANVTPPSGLSPNANTTCLHMSNTYRQGETFLHNRARLQCGANGQLNVTACLSPTGQEYPVGADITDKDTRYRCVKDGTLHRYEELTVVYSGPGSRRR